jgi:hypothetical protein
VAGAAGRRAEAKLLNARSRIAERRMRCAQPRGWCSYGGLDPNVVGTLQAAASVSYDVAGVYLFPCPSQDPAGQVHQLVAGLEQVRGRGV